MATHNDEQAFSIESDKALVEINDDVLAYADVPQPVPITLANDLSVTQSLRIFA